MGKLDRMPSLEIISRFAGIVDFYCWKGIACFRAWPKMTYPAYHSQVLRNIVLAQGVEAYQGLTEVERAFWREKALGFHKSGYDIFMSVWLKTH